MEKGREIEEAEFFLSMLISWREGDGEAGRKSRGLVLIVSPRCWTSTWL